MGLQWWDDFQEKHPKIADALYDLGEAAKAYLPPINYITLHYAYFIITAIIATLIFWGTSNPPHSIGWWDSMFMCMSALTAAGLNTVNVSQLSTTQQVILVVLIIMGNQVLISFTTVAFRKHIFEKRFDGIVEAERQKRKDAQKMSDTGAVVGMTGAMFGLQVMSSFGPGSAKPKPRAPPNAPNAPGVMATGPTTARSISTPNQDSEADKLRIGFLEPIQEGKPSPGGEGHGTPLGRLRSPSGTTTAHSIYDHNPHMHRRHSSAQSTDGFNLQVFLKEKKRNIGRNGQLFNLSDEQREYLGGVEYRALKFLSSFVLVYFVLWQFLGAIALGAWMSVYAKDTSLVNAQNPWWAGIFLAISAYGNAGFTLLDAGFIPFQNSWFVLIVVTVLSLAGPAAFPVFLRFIIWVMSCFTKRFSQGGKWDIWDEGFDFILKFPRRVYTSMFPAKATWSFIATFVGFVVLDWVLILVLGIGNPTLEAIPVAQRIFDALFEGGYAIVSPAGMYFSIQVLWVLIMYTAAYPHIITMRASNVYEERSLGIYQSDEVDEEQLHSENSSLFDAELANNGPKHHDNRSLAPSHLSTVTIKKLAAVGRRGTAFVGRQIQRRMTSFQGVGVSGRAPDPGPPFLRRAKSIDPTRASLHSLKHHAPPPPSSLMSQQLRSQLSHDVWWIALALFLITIIETRHSLDYPAVYSVFNFLFEIVSGYTTIGISIGLPDQAYSLSGGMYTGSKIVMILVMLRGRHRGLPVALDRAVRLPGKKLNDHEEEDAEIRRSLSRTMIPA